jgi:hypothetical protein
VTTAGSRREGDVRRHGVKSEMLSRLSFCESVRKSVSTPLKVSSVGKKTYSLGGLVDDACPGEEEPGQTLAPSDDGGPTPRSVFSILRTAAGTVFERRKTH